MDALSRGLQTRRVLQQMQRENDERMRVTALSVARGVGVELTEDEQGDLDVTGDKGPNTHWVHGENIEIAVNM